MLSSSEEDLDLIDGDSESDGDDDTSGSEVDDDYPITNEAKVEVPEDVPVRGLPCDIACHPKRNLIAAGMFSGHITLHSYGTGDEKNVELETFDHHKKSCQAVHFSLSGERLFSGDDNGNIYEFDFETISVVRDYTRQGASAIRSILPIDEYLLASGEYDGQLVLWDSRAPTPIDFFTDCEFPISSLAINEDKTILLATSYDSRLTVYDVRTKKLVTQSEELSSKLLCCGIIKGGTKAVVGSADGALNIFNWGEFGNVSERFPSHPTPVQSLVVLSEDVVITGCFDGNVRAVQMFPNRVLGNLGNHNSCPIHKVCLTFDSKFVASLAFHQNIKFWDLSGVDELRNEDVRD